MAGPRRIELPPVPNGWYRAAYSDELDVGQVQPLSILGREFALYRGHDGRPRVVDGYCPHLGAHLGYGGRVDGDALVCPFHAWKWSGDTGACLDIPYCERIPARARVGVRPTREQSGYVMFWFDAESREPWFEVPDIPEATDPAFRLYKRVRWELDTHVQEIYENVVDRQHLSSLHGMEVRGSSWEPMGGENSPLVRLTIDMDRDVALGEVEADAYADDSGHTDIESWMWGPGLQCTRLSGKLRGVSVNSLTPIGEEKVEVAHAYYVQTTDSDDPKQVEAFWDYYMEDHYLDFEIWNHKRYLDAPALAPGDGDVAQFRRWFRQFYP